MRFRPNAPREAHYSSESGLLLVAGLQDAIQLYITVASALSRAGAESTYSCEMKTRS